MYGFVAHNFNVKKLKIENTARHLHSFSLHQNTHSKVRVV